MSHAFDRHDQNHVIHRIYDAVVAYAIRKAFSLPCNFGIHWGEGCWRAFRRRARPVAEPWVRAGASPCPRSGETQRRNAPLFFRRRFTSARGNGWLILPPRDHRQIVQILQQFLVFIDREDDCGPLSVLDHIFSFGVAVFMTTVAYHPCAFPARARLPTGVLERIARGISATNPPSSTRTARKRSTSRSRC